MPGLLSYLEAAGPRRPAPTITVLARSESLDSLTLDGPRGRATLGLRPAALIRVLPGDGRSGAVPPGAGPRRDVRALQSDDDLDTRPHRAQPDRPAPHRHGPDGAVQLPVRPPHRRHVPPPPRGHRRRPQHGRVREGHPRRPALAGDHAGTRVPRSAGGEEAARTRRIARCSASTRYADGCRRPARCATRPTRASARPRSSTRTARRRRRRTLPPKYVGRCADADRRASARARGRGAAGPRSASGSAPGVVAFDDLVRGRVEIDTSNLGGDFVIVRGDGTPLYHFTVVVDDAAMEISHVIRGEDHLSNTPKHILLFRALGHAVPSSPTCR